MSKPVVIDLCCGLGGWSKGFIAEGWDAIGFDIEHHCYAGPEPCSLREYPGHLILADVLTLNGYDLRAANPSLIVASPPCTEYSYMAMPWKRGKQIAAALRSERGFPEGYTGSQTLTELNALFVACFRIARECGVPIVLENVKGAQPWVGRAKANFGSYYLWGDMARIGNRVVRDCKPVFGMAAVAAGKRMKNSGGTWFGHVDGHATERNDPRDMRRDENGAWVNAPNGVKRDGRNFHGPERGESSPSFNRRAVSGTKQHGSGPEWFDHGAASHGSRSSARKAASALIAEIPFELARHVARVFKP